MRQGIRLYGNGYSRTYVVPIFMNLIYYPKVTGIGVSFRIVKLRNHESSI